MKSFKLSILAAERTFYEGECESLIIPTVDGQYGIMAGHSNLISAIIPGTLSYRVPGGNMQYAAVSEGMIKVRNNQVLILVDSVLRPDEIDEDRARRAADAAREAILQKRSIQEYRLAQADLSRALNRLKVKNSHIAE